MNLKPFKDYDESDVELRVHNREITHIPEPGWNYDILFFHMGYIWSHHYPQKFILGLDLTVETLENKPIAVGKVGLFDDLIWNGTLAVPKGKFKCINCEEIPNNKYKVTWSRKTAI